MQSIYNRIEVAFANVDLSIFEKQNIMPLYNTLNERMYRDWDNLPHDRKFSFYWQHYGNFPKGNLLAPYNFRLQWIQQNLESNEEHEPIIEGFKSYYNL